MSLHTTPEASLTLVELLLLRAQIQPDQHLYTFLHDSGDSEDYLSYQVLDQRARMIGAALQQAYPPGERALLLYPPGLDYIAAFFGCLYAGLVAVPAYPPNPARLDRTLGRLQAIVQDARPAAALTTSAIRPLAELLAAQDAVFQPITWIATDALDPRLADTWRPPEVGAETLAFLQYTSGSTATPKGVMLTHRNLLHNSAQIKRCFGHSSASRGVIWLPPYHDMGLIGGILQPLYAGFPVTLLSPVAFLQQPFRWLQAISRYQATTSGGPNFAYDLCARKITPEQRAQLDLSSWRVAFNGAEPIRPETLARFAEVFEPCGFRGSAFYPCYGLAESTLIVSGGPTDAAPVIQAFRPTGAAHDALEAAPAEAPGVRRLVGSGLVLPDEQIAIIHPETRQPCQPGQIGEIWVASPSVAQGYWERPDETAQTFRQRLPGYEGAQFLRTGDLGILHAGELFVTGRLKDLIIIRGRNYYPQDIELTVERSSAAFRPGCGAAFSVPVEGEERLVVVQELDRQARSPDVPALAATIRQAVAEQHEVQVYAVALIKHGSLPKTSSGKIQHRATRDKFLEGGLELIGSDTLEVRAAEGAAPPREASLITRTLAAVTDPAARQAVLTVYLQEQIARICPVSPAQVGPQQLLSALGLDSLMAVELKYALETELGVVLPLESLLQGGTLADLAALLLTDGLRSVPTPLRDPAGAAEPPSELPLSHGQRAIWFLQRLAPGSSAYNIASAVRIPAELDTAALGRAFQILAARHPSLRAIFPAEGGEPVQRIRGQIEVPFQAIDASGWSAAQLDAALAEASGQPFDIERDPLLRVTLFSRSAQDHVLLLLVHHIVADFWSLAVLLEELGTCYAKARAGAPSALPPLPAQYADYVRWQAETLAGAEGQRLWSYWQTKLAGDLPALDLPADRPRPPAQTYRGAAQTLRLDPRLSQRLRDFSRAQGATLYTTLLAAFQVLLHRYTGQRDILVGSPTAGRSRADLARLVGYFVNPVVLRADLSGDPPFRRFLEQVRQTVQEAFAHQDYPFPLLVERLQPNRDPSRSPIFQVLFSLQKVPLLDSPELAAFAVGAGGARISIGGMELESVALEQHSAQFDLALAAADTPQGLVFSMQYNSDLFETATVERMLGHLGVLLEHSVSQPDQRVSRLPLLPEAERRQILQSWNATQAAYPAETCIHELFEAQAARTPEAPALIFEGQRLTYGELNRRADQLARRLLPLGVAPGVLVGVCVERSVEMVVGLLAVLKAGAAYVPLDPLYPRDRLASMLQDSGAQVLLTQSSLAGWLPDVPVRRVLLDTGAGLPADGAAPEGSQRAASADLAYVIYTSGSTGAPKGVQIPHGAVVNFLESMRRQPGLAAHDVLVSVTTLAFDIAALELFLPLTTGAQLVLASRAVAMDGARLAALLASSGATCMQATPATWRLLIESGWAGGRGLKVLCGGEALPRDLANALTERCGELWNMYGPTETTIWSATGCLERADGPVPIGGPIANTQLYLLDAHLNPVPIGVPGELYIGGDGLARGYFGRPDLTAERFVPNPFWDERPTTNDQRPTATGQGGAADEGSLAPTLYRSSAVPLYRSGPRLYRTGDLARYRLDAEGRPWIEFLGRIDHQVKVRGFRIELAEIETLLNQHPAVLESVVTAQRWGGADDQRLVAYVVPAAEAGLLAGEQAAGNGGAPPVAQTLRAALREKLPDYMVPSVFVAMEALPRTPNGKIDRRALPPPGEARERPEAAYVAPRGELERTIAQIWQEVLGLERVGTSDNFFDLGGHSLLMARVHARLQEAVRRELSMVELFQYPTVGALAHYLSPSEEQRPASQAGHERAARRRSLAGQPESGIAVIGMAGRFPGAPTLDQFWRNLCDGAESIRFFSDEEARAAGVDDALLANPRYVKAGAVLDDVAGFDAAFFGYNPREAEIMDPQHRIFLECAWEALERAGYDSERYGGRIGVYAGVGLNAYLLNNLSSQRDLMQSAEGYQAFIGNDKDFVPTRVSYKLNLRGPSLNVQTACSSSLVAIHIACQSLLSGECDMALAGGVAVNLPQQAGYLYQERGIASPDGHCRAFDARAGGTVRGSGAGVVVLKRLADALADGDLIDVVIKGTAINNDGALKAGYTAPSVEGQAAAIAEALALAGAEPETIGYVEAHGTGTEIGDPIEVAALTQVFRQGTEARGFCGLGSVKTNIGHLDTAAGVAGFIKTALALKHGQIPPSLHYEQPNPRIDFASSPFYVNAALAEWRADGRPRRAGVSAFGVGGTNAHAVLEQAPEQPASGPSRPWQLLLLSAKTSSALERATEQLAAHLREHPEINLADAASTLQVGRRVLPHRRALVCRSTGDARAALETLDPARVLTAAYDRGPRPVVFLFSGQGSQYAEMAQGLYESEPVFHAELDRCAELLRPHLGLDLREILYPGQRPTTNGFDKRRTTKDEGTISIGRTPDVSADQGSNGIDRPPNVSTAELRPSSLVLGRELEQTWLAQPALFAIEYALAQLWMSWGVKPQAMIGHSIGEYVAACLAGVFSLEDALALVAERGRLMQSLPPGAMLAVSLPERDLQPMLGEELSFGAINGPDSCVVSGPSEAIERLERRLAARGIHSRRLHTSHAFHSAMMDPILDVFTQRVERCALNPPQLPYISNVTGTWAAAEVTDPRYWARHLRQAVRFADGLAELFKDSDSLLLEVGPGRALTTLALRHPARATDQMVLSSLRHPQDQIADSAFVLNALGKLWLAGAPINWASFYAHERRRRVALPTYPFEHQSYWVEPQPRGATGARPAAPGERRPDMADWFYVPSWRRSALAQAHAPRAPADWLVFADEHGLGSRLAEGLERTGQTQQVVLVRPGAAFTQIGPREYALRPGEPGDYDALFEALRAQEIRPQQIVHAWGLAAGGEDGPALARLDQAQETGFYSLLFLAQALGRHAGANPIQLSVITGAAQEVTGEERLRPERATALGPIQIIPHEYPNIRCRGIDVLPDAGALGRLGATLLAEITSGASDPLVAYRGSHRWVQSFEPLRLERPEGPVPALREGGAYLITGGLGGVGLVLARHLAGTARAKLALIGRSVDIAADPASPQGRAVRDLEALGAEVLLVRADVADQAAVRTALAQMRERFGRIDGVIHAAGVPGGGLIQLKTREQAEQVMAAKVRGTLVLAEALGDAPLDFFALCSSINAVVGRLGQADYAAANAFQDAFAAAGAAWPLVSINWETWREVGMAAGLLKEAGGGAVGHPLLDQRLAAGEGQAAYLTRFAVDTHWPLFEHWVLGKPTLPGTAYLEMACAALADHTHTGALEIRDAHFLTPLILEGDERRTARTLLRRQGDSWTFSVLSQIGEAWQEHARGTIAPAGPQPPRVLLSEIEDRCGAETIGDPLERSHLGSFALQRRTLRRRSAPEGEPPQVESILIAEEGDVTLTRSMEFGPRWQSLCWVKLGEREGLAWMELPEAHRADVRRYTLHPALLDFATSFLRLFKSAGSYLPLSYKRLRVWAPLPARLYSYVRFADSGRPQGATLRFDVQLLDEHGAVLAEIEEFAVLRIDDLSKVGARAAQPADLAGSPQARAAEARARLIQEDLRTGLAPAEGVEVFERILANPLRRVVVSTRALPERIEQGRASSALLLAGPETSADAPRAKHPRPQLMNAYAAPRNETEQKLAEIWQDVLGIEQVGIHDNFFELGGDSLLITRIHVRFSERFDRQVSVASLLQYPTIADLAQSLAERAAAEQPSFEELHDRTSRQKAAMKQRQQKMLKKRTPT
jgi:amino acid adenylation domain-containing protein